MTSEKTTTTQTSETTKTASPKKKKKNVEEEFVKLDQIEHALTRPDMYIGTTEQTKDNMWVYDPPNGMAYRTVRLSPGLYKIFDEILVNAADNKQRDPTMKKINVVIDPEKNFFVC